MRVKIYTAAGVFDVYASSTQQFEETYPAFIPLEVYGESANINVRRSAIIAYEVLRD